LVHHRQVDRVTITAQARVFDIVVELRIGRERLLHRMRRNRIGFRWRRRDTVVLEWPEDLVRLSGRKLASDVVIQEPLEGVLAGLRVVANYVMTGRAAYAVPR